MTKLEKNILLAMEDAADNANTKVVIEEAKEDNKSFFEYAKARDKEVREAVDGLFGPGVSDGLFHGVSSYAMADSLPLWTNFLLAVIDTVPEELSKQVKTSKPRVEKYLKKYHR